MPLLDQFPRIALEQIIIPRDLRQRQSDRLASGEVETDGLQASIARSGVLMPLLVEVLGQDGPEPQWKLIAGERRLQACINLVAEGTVRAKNDQDLTTVPVRLARDLPPLEAELFELEENIKRQDLHWIDLVRGTARIHAICRERDIEWTHNETAEICSLKRPTASLYLRVFNNLDDERVLAA